MKPRDVFIVAWIAIQIVAPASYYLRSEPAERYDERFAWRMFSDIRMVRCQADFRVDGEPEKLSETFHTAWNSLLARGRPQVVEAVTARLCADNPGSTVHLKLRCREPDGSIEVLETGETDLCEGR